MVSGFNTAFDEITLVFFTTLAPSGAVAVGIIAALLLTYGTHLNDSTRRARVDKWLCVPIVVSMAGLVASATHLGNPANALYVFMGVGRSPLSTEVFCAVMFLLFAGVYWLYSFSRKPRRWLQNILLLFQTLTAAAFVTAVAFAYSAETIESWDTVYVPLNLWLNALVGGPVLTLLTLQIAQWIPQKHFGRACLIVSVVALFANTIAYALQGRELQTMENSMVRAVDLVPEWWAMLTAFFLLIAVGLAMAAYAEKTMGAVESTADRGSATDEKSAAVEKSAIGEENAAESTAGEENVAGKKRATGEENAQGIKDALPTKRARYLVIAANMFVFAGIFVMRFAFYMMHMTVGLGV